MEVLLTTGAIRRTKLQLNHHHQQNQHPVFYRPDAFPVAQPTVSELQKIIKSKKLDQPFLKVS